MPTDTFGIPEATWVLWDRIGILIGFFTFGVSVAGAAWGIAQRESIRRWFVRNRFPNVGAEVSPEHDWDALVFTVSKPDVPNWVIEQCKPKFVGLVATEQSKPAAEAIRAQALSRGIRVAETGWIANEDDPADAKAQTRWVVAQLKQTGAERIAVDITGGKTPMSLGAFMAAEEKGVASLYVASRFDQELKKPDMRTAKIHCISEPG